MTVNLIILRLLDQVPTVNITEKSPLVLLLAGKGKKEPFENLPEHSALLNKASLHSGGTS